MFKFKVDTNFWEVSQADIPIPQYIHLISLNKKREGKGTGEGLVSPRAIYAPFPFNSFFFFFNTQLSDFTGKKKKTTVYACKLKIHVSNNMQPVLMN